MDLSRGVIVCLGLAVTCVDVGEVTMLNRLMVGENHCEARVVVEFDLDRRIGWFVSGHHVLLRELVTSDNLQRALETFRNNCQRLCGAAELLSDLTVS